DGGGRQVLQEAVATDAPLPTLLQVSLKTPFTMPPRAKTMTTIRAAIAATSRPYSTAEAPFSSLRFTRRSRMCSMTGSPKVCAVGLRRDPLWVDFSTLGRGTAEICGNLCPVLSDLTLPSTRP